MFVVSEKKKSHEETEDTREWRFHTHNNTTTTTTNNNNNNNNNNKGNTYAGHEDFQIRLEVHESSLA
jgi:hypothetical protein